MINLFKVFMPESVMAPLRETLLSGFIGQGPRVDEFEALLKKMLQYQNLVTVNSGTSALHLALRLAGVKQGSEVLTTPLTCFATNAPILERGGRIRWVDIDPTTCNIDLNDLRHKVTKNTAAIVVVHWGGYPVDLDELSAIAAIHNTPVIEDCAHAMGSIYKGNAIGNSGNYCAFSLQAIKLLTVGDGGVLCVPPNKLNDAKLLRWYGLDREANSKSFRCEMPIKEYGYKFHLNDIAATIGINQMQYVAANLAIHQSNAIYYNSALRDVRGVTLMENRNDVGSSYWLYTIRVERQADFIKHMTDNGIQVSTVHARNDKHPCVAEFAEDLPQLDKIVSEMICIPVGWWVSEKDREYIVNMIKAGW